VQVAHPSANAALALHGAHLISWQPTDARPVIYTSPEAIYREGKAIRGGIPLCWPWFGAHPTNPSKPSHGFARDRFWDLAQVTEDEDALRLVFHLPPLAPEERSLFPHHHALEFTLHIGRALKAALRTTNLDDEEMVVGGRVRFQVNYNCDLEQASEVARRAIQATDRVLPGTAEIVVRSLWDDKGGHMGSGILMEGRYRIENVRNRTKIRSEVLTNISKQLKAEGIPLASPRVRIEQV
jgi:hypothetical protein